MRTKIQSLLITLALLPAFNLQLSTAFALGTAFTYQGRLNDGGRPANGLYDFRFKLAPDPLDTANVGSAFVTNAIPVTNGLFTTSIDYGADIFNGSNYWLEVDVRTNNPANTLNYTMLTPLQAVTPTPNAIYAENAGGVTGLTVQANTNGAPNVIGGSSLNSVATGVIGATIAGGGAVNYQDVTYSNSVTAGFGTVSGGFGNTINGVGATVGGGFENTAIGDYSTIAGGFDNIASGYVSTALGDESTASGRISTAIGNNSMATGDFSTALGDTTLASGTDSTAFGNETTAGGDNSTVSGGIGSNASGLDATIGGGYYNSATNTAATVPGGENNVAGGVASFAAGNEAKAINAGAFVWGDNTGTITTSAAANSVTFRASGGYRLFTGTGAGGASLPAGMTAWTSISDRNAKKNFRSVDTVAVLDKLAAIPVQQWNYKWEKDSDVPNIGPMAQDFKHAFYPGRDDKGISTLEFDGVELAAIQGLNQKLEEQKAENSKLERSVAELKELVQSLMEKK
jgi:hypothetical protein